MPVLREHEVEVELVRQALVQAHALAVERGALGRAVVRADDRRVPARRARADVRLLEDRHVADAVPLREVVRRREPVRPAADDDDLVAALQLGPRPPHPLGEEDLLHRGLGVRSGPVRDPWTRPERPRRRSGRAPAGRRRGTTRPRRGGRAPVTRANGPAVGICSRSRSVSLRMTCSLAIAIPASAPVAS